jgi:DNA-binding PadR family transcriptional regulator
MNDMTEEYGHIPDAFYLSQEEIETLRKSKKELTEYGKEKLRKMMNNYIPDDDVIEEMVNVKLTEEKKEELERLRRRETVLSRYNQFYNDECSGMPNGTPITPEHMQALALECMVDALICENMNVEYNAIAIDDIKDLIAGLYQQSNDYLKRVKERVKEIKDSAEGTFLML